MRWTWSCICPFFKFPQTNRWEGRVFSVTESFHQRKSLIKSNKHATQEKDSLDGNMVSRESCGKPELVTNSHKILLSLFTCGPSRITLPSSPYVPPCPLLTHPSLSFSLALSSPSREAVSPDPVWKSATHIPPQSTLLWESQAPLHERQRDRGTEWQAV